MFSAGQNINLKNQQMCLLCWSHHGVKQSILYIYFFAEQKKTFKMADFEKHVEVHCALQEVYR